jgi:hypothetical protein
MQPMASKFLAAALCQINGDKRERYEEEQTVTLL